MATQTSGFAVQGIAAQQPSSLAQIPMTTPVNPAAFRGDFGQSIIQGAQVGTEMARPMWDVAMKLGYLNSPQGQAEREAALAKAKLETAAAGAAQETLPLETSIKRRSLGLEGNVIDWRANMFGLPSSGGEAPDNYGPTPVGGDAPALSSATVAATPDTETDPSAARTQTVAQEQAQYQRDKVLGTGMALPTGGQLPGDANAAARAAAVEEMNKKIVEQGLGDPLKMTQAEKVKALQQISPLAVEGRKTQNEMAEKWISSREVIDYHTALGSLRGMEQLMSLPPSSANDFTLTYRFMRTIDPQMGVRESQQEAAQHIGSVPQHLMGAVKKVLNGETLTEGQRKQIMQAAVSTVKGMRPAYEQSHAAAARRISLVGGDPTALNELANDQIAIKSGLSPSAAKEGGDGNQSSMMMKPGSAKDLAPGTIIFQEQPDKTEKKYQWDGSKMIPVR